MIRRFIASCQLNRPKFIGKNTCQSMRQAVKFFSFSTRKTQFTKNEVFLILIVFHISGVFTAAFDTQLEWLTVKGIADFADGEQVHAES